MDVSHNQARFQIFVPGGDYVPDLFQVWQSVTNHSSDDNDKLVLLVDLPADTSTVAASLIQQIAMVQTKQCELLHARLRLHTFTDYVGQTARSATNFAAHNQELLEPERELMVLLQLVTNKQAFLLSENLQGKWTEISHQAQAFFNQVGLSLASSIRVETTIDGIPIGRTTIGWLGDMKTIWRLDLAADQAMLHQQALALALNSRAAWSRAALHIVTGAVRIAALLTVPGAAYLAIPATWYFIKQVLADARQLHKLSGG